MTGDQPHPGLFWLAGCFVLMVLITVAAKLFLATPGRPRRTLWIVALACVMPACASAVPPPTPPPTDTSGWSTPFDHDDFQRT